MNTTERNWSSIYDFEGGNFGYRAFYTREQWIEQAIEWSQDRCDDENEYIEWLNSLDDEELMHYIQEHWSIEIRETTWLKVGNQCWYKDYWDVESGVYTILSIPTTIETDSLITITNERGNEQEVCLGHLYGLTDKICPRCKKPLYVSDLCSYPYVCLDCDENFYGIEAI